MCRAPFEKTALSVNVALDLITSVAMGSVSVYDYQKGESEWCFACSGLQVGELPLTAELKSCKNLSGILS